MKKEAIILYINRRIILSVAYTLSSVVRNHNEDRVILCYHSIGKGGNRYTVSPKVFEEQIKKIKSFAKFVSLSEIIDLKKKSSKMLVSLTFDDGYADIISVLPVLKKYNIPATVFALSDPEQANRSELEHNGKLLSYKQLKQLHNDGIKIGCHSATHADFHHLPNSRRYREINMAKKSLEKQLGTSIDYFAYPKGRFNAECVNDVVKAGFKAAFTTVHENVGSSRSNYVIPRVVIDGTFTEKDFPAVISTTTFFIQRMHRSLAYNRFILGVRSLFTSHEQKRKQFVSDLITKHVTVSIGTSAFNEGKNIKNFLNSVLTQSGKHISIKEILVLNDGSTDDTVEQINSFSDKRIKLFNHHERLGKSSRLNQIFKSFSSDVLVILDADGFLSSPGTIEKLVQPMLIDKNVGLVAGRMNPVSPESLIEKSVVNYYLAHYKAVKMFDYDKSAYECHGLLAYKRSFASTLKIPDECLVDDAYSYFSCLSNGYSYRFVSNAVVRYRCPQTIRDYLKQSLRYYAGGEQLFEYFSKKDVVEGYSLPRGVLVRTFLFQLKQNFFGYILLKFMHAFVLYKTRVRRLKLDVQWPVIQSSKIL